MFERFRQADATAAREHSGLGLGLSIVRELTELHGGSVKAFSDGPRRGSSFTVSRPLLDASAAASSGLAAARDYGEVIGRP